MVLSLEALIQVPQVREFDISPDGGKIAFSWNRGGKWDIYVKDLVSEELYRLIDGLESAFDPNWSPDGRRIAYVSDRAGDENFDIFIVSASGGEPLRLTEDSHENSSPRWTPDGKWILFLSNRGGDNLNLFRLSVETGEMERLTEGYEPIFTFSISPTGRYVAFFRGFMNSSLWLLDLVSGTLRKAISHPNAEVEVGWNSWSPSGLKLLYTSNVNNFYDIGVYDVESGRWEWFENTPFEKYSPTWSPDGSKVAFLENVDGNVLLKVKPVKGGKAIQLGFSKGVCESPRWSPKGDRLFFLYSGPKEPYDVWAVDVGGKPERVTSSLRDEVDRDELVEPEVVRYKSHDGLEVPAWIYRPKRAMLRLPPAIVVSHGGPEAQFVNEWEPLIQFLVHSGFVVVAPNFRGSAGYGRKYQRMSDRDLGGGDLMDVVAAAKYLKECGIADPKKVGIFGVSYGGYMVMMALTKHPDIWAAGACVAGFFNWKTEFEAEREYLKFYDAQKVGAPEESPEFYYDRSPANFIDRVKAPVLILHGAKDPRCPVNEAYHIIDLLRKYGKTFEFKIYHDEGHAFRKVENRLDAYKRIVDLFNKCMCEQCLGASATPKHPSS